MLGKGKGGIGLMGVDWLDLVIVVLGVGWCVIGLMLRRSCFGGIVIIRRICREAVRMWSCTQCIFERMDLMSQDTSRW